LCLKRASTCVVLAAVFGKVVEGMALVRKAEATGTQSGKPRQPVLIADSGEVCIARIHPFMSLTANTTGTLPHPYNNSCQLHAENAEGQQASGMVAQAIAGTFCNSDCELWDTAAHTEIP